MEIQKILLESTTKINKKQTGKLRVAAYCRVSTDTKDQKTSFEGQVNHYSELITSNPEWEFAGVFADEGITGTSAARRPQFQTMMRVCGEGKIDLILTKSISRFARNTLECLSFVRHLNNTGVHIVFESNNIDTRMAFSEMLLTVLAAFAQEESRSISENTSWGIRKRFEEGVTRWCRLYGYEKNEYGEYQIVPEQAAVVQKIYDLYEHGESIQKIRKYLEANGIKSPTGKPKWTNSAIHTLMINERYTGDILLQKFITESHLTHKSVKNDSTQIPSFYIENHHVAIISKKQYERCMKIMGMRRVIGHKKEYDTGTCNQYPLGDKLRCPYCGSTLYQRNIPVQAKNGSGWCCEKGENACHGFIIRSKLVESALLEAYRKLDAEKIAEKMKIHSNEVNEINENNEVNETAYEKLDADKIAEKMKTHSNEVNEINENNEVNETAYGKLDTEKSIEKMKTQNNEINEINESNARYETAYGKLDAEKSIEKRKIQNNEINKNNETDVKLALEIKKEYPVFKSVEFWWVEDLIDHIEFGTHKTFSQERFQTLDNDENVMEDRTEDRTDDHREDRTDDSSEDRTDDRTYDHTEDCTYDHTDARTDECSEGNSDACADECSGTDDRTDDHTEDWTDDSSGTDDCTDGRPDDCTMSVFWRCGLTTTVMSGANTPREHPPYIAELYNNYLERHREK